MLAGDKIRKYIDGNDSGSKPITALLFFCPKCGKTWTETHETPEDTEDDDSSGDLIKCIEYFEDFFSNMLCKEIPADIFRQYLCGLDEFITKKITSPIARSGGYLLKTYAGIDHAIRHASSKDAIILALDDIRKALDIHETDEYKAYQSMCNLLSLHDNRDLDISHYEIIKDTCPDILSLEDTFIDVGHTSERFNDIYTFVTESAKHAIVSEKANAANEREYLDELRACLGNGAAISSGERRLLDKLRLKLGISERRAAELECM